MPYTPAQLAQADQTLAAFNQSLDQLTDSARTEPHTPQGVDELAVILLDKCTPESLAVALALAIFRLSEVAQ